MPQQRQALDRASGSDGNIATLAVDDHGAFREALRDLVAAARGFVLVGEACSGEEAVRAVDQLSPRLVLMDVVMPGISGVAAARVILNKHPEVVVVLISVDDPALNSGTAGLGNAVACARKQDLRPDSLRRFWETRWNRAANAATPDIGGDRPGVRAGSAIPMPRGAANNRAHLGVNAAALTRASARWRIQERAPQTVILLSRLGTPAKPLRGAFRTPRLGRPQGNGQRTGRASPEIGHARDSFGSADPDLRLCSRGVLPASSSRGSSCPGAVARGRAPDGVIVTASSRRRPRRHRSSAAALVLAARPTQAAPDRS